MLFPVNINVSKNAGGGGGVGKGSPPRLANKMIRRTVPLGYSWQLCCLVAFQSYSARENLFATSTQQARQANEGAKNTICWRSRCTHPSTAAVLLKVFVGGISEASNNIELQGHAEHLLQQRCTKTGVGYVQAFQHQSRFLNRLGFAGLLIVV